MLEVQGRLRDVHAELRKHRRREAAAFRYACSRKTMHDVHRRNVAVALLHLQHHDATLAVQYLLQHPPESLPAPEYNADTVHAWEAERVAAGHEDPLEPALRQGPRGLDPATPQSGKNT